MRAPLGLSDPFGENVKRGDSRHELDGCQGKLLERGWIRQVALWRERLFSCFRSHVVLGRVP